MGARVRVWELRIGVDLSGKKVRRVWEWGNGGENSRTAGRTARNLNCYRFLPHLSPSSPNNLI